MHCGRKYLGVILFIVNIVCMCLGLLLIWSGQVVKENGALSSNNEELSVLLVTMAGIVVIVVAIYGCMAVVRKSKTMLIAYAVILVVLVIVQLILISVDYVTVGRSMEKALQRGFDELWDRTDYTNSTLSLFEERLQCCGRHSAGDYFQLDKVPPPSCCLNHDCTNILHLFVVGCETSFKNYVHSNVQTVNCICGLLIVFEFLGSITACGLIDRIRNHQDLRHCYG